MVNPGLVVSLVFAVAAVLFCFLPLVPGHIFSAVGVILFMVFGQPKGLELYFTLFLLLLSLSAIIFDLVAGVFAAEKSGASRDTSVFAVLAGFAGFVALGPVGLVAGSLAAIILLEDEVELGEAFKTQLYILVSIGASALFQVLSCLFVLLAIFAMIMF